MSGASVASLSAACAKHPKVFNTLFVTMVQAGEAGGHLDSVLLELASTIEKQAVLRRKVRSAMTYPIIVLSVMVVIFLALLIFIVPVFQKLFTSLHAKLPFPTLIVIGISKIVLSVWAVLLVILLIAGIVMLRRWIKTPAGRLKWDAFKLKLPVVGALIRMVAVTRFSSTMATLLSSGVPMGASHGIGYVLGAEFGVPHGHTSCIMLPAVMRWNKPANRDRQALISAAMLQAGSDAGDVLDSLIRGLEMPRSLGAVKIGRDNFQRIAVRLERRATTKNNENQSVCD